MEEEYSKPFDARFKDAYVYDTVGGNNLRLALQELLREKPELRTNKLFSHRLCSVYRRMETQLALRLASKHNRATSFSHEMTTWDKVLANCWFLTKKLRVVCHVLKMDTTYPSNSPSAAREQGGPADAATVEDIEMDPGLVILYDDEVIHIALGQPGSPIAVQPGWSVVGGGLSSCLQTTPFSEDQNAVVKSQNPAGPVEYFSDVLERLTEDNMYDVEKHLRTSLATNSSPLGR